MIKYLVLLLLLIPSLTWAACPADDYETTTCLYGETGTCRLACDTSLAKVTAAITASSSSGTGLAADGSAFGGDGVYIPAGEVTWDGKLTVSNKNVLIAGSGTLGTKITSHFVAASGDYSAPIAFSATDASKAKWRVTNLELITDSTTVARSSLISIKYSTDNEYATGWRFDHLKITIDVTNSTRIFYIEGPTYGLIDSCELYNGKIEVRPYLSGTDTTGYLGSYERSLSTGYGTNRAVFVENNIWERRQNASNNVLTDTDYGGGSLVLRYNNYGGGCWFTHGSRSSGQLGPKRFEAYNNILNGDTDYTPKQGYVGRIIGGTGVFYNNTISGFTSNVIYLDDYRATGADTSGKLGACDGTLTHIWDGNAECTNGTLYEEANGDGSCPTGGYTNTGWPCYGQPGTGTGTVGTDGATSLANEPFYAWGNGATILYPWSSGLAHYIKSYSSPHASGAYEYHNASSMVDANTRRVALGLSAYSTYACPHPSTGLSGSCTSTIGPTGYNVSGEDTTDPTLSLASISSAGTELHITLSEDVTVNTNTGFALSCSGDGDESLTYTSESNGTLVYGIAKTVQQGETCTLAYTTGSNYIEDAAGNDLDSFTGQSVTNLSNQNTPPTQTLTVTKTGAGCRVISAPEGVNCGSTCSLVVATGTVVTLSGRSENGWNAITYGGDCAANGTVTMSAAKECTVTCTETKLNTFCR